LRGLRGARENLVHLSGAPGDGAEGDSEYYGVPAGRSAFGAQVRVLSGGLGVVGDGSGRVGGDVKVSVEVPSLPFQNADGKVIGAQPILPQRMREGWATGSGYLVRSFLETSSRIFGRMSARMLSTMLASASAVASAAAAWAEPFPPPTAAAMAASSWASF
jgi:hypothetical protein